MSPEERYALVQALRTRLIALRKEIAGLRSWAYAHRRSVEFGVQYGRTVELEFALSLLEVPCAVCGETFPPKKDGTPRAHACGPADAPYARAERGHADARTE